MHYNKTVFCSFLAFLACAAPICHAQSVDKPTTTLAIDKPVGEFDFDIRSTLPAFGGSDTRLYSSSLRFDTGLLPGLRLHLNAVDKYGDYLAQEATLEQEWRSNRVALGMIRIPFGIYNYQETYGSGLVNYPLARGDYGFNTVDWGVPGAQWTGGNPRLQIEAAAFQGRASGLWGNTNIVGGAALRAQTYVNGLILGASYWDGYFDTNFGHTMQNAVRMAGIDARYTLPHLVLRGEYLLGLYGSDQAHGWYLDAYYHLPKFEKFTLTARLEAYNPSSDGPTGRQITLGLRYAASPQWTFVINWINNNGSHFYDYSWTPNAGRAGNLLFQVYHKIKF